MSGDTLVAQEIQDLSRAVGEVADAVRESGSRPVDVNLPAPVLQVSVPEQPAAVINFSPEVNVEPGVFSPVIQVQPTDVRVQLAPSLPSAYQVNVTRRDTNGMIAEFVIIPITA